MDMEQWLIFLREHWFVVLLALIALWIVIKLVKTVIKWVLVIAIIAAVIIYGGYTMDDLKSVGTQVVDTVKDELLRVMTSEMKDAQYKQNEDGSFTVYSKNVELSGKPGEPVVTVKFKGQTISKFQIDETIESFIEQSKQNSQ